MFINREEYNSLRKSERELLEFKLEVEELRKKLRGYESGLHKCGDLCQGCQHLVEGEIFYSTGDSMSSIRSHKTKLCALDRTCKDYKEKECSK